MPTSSTATDAGPSPDGERPERLRRRPRPGSGRLSSLVLAPTILTLATSLYVVGAAPAAPSPPARDPVLQHSTAPAGDPPADEADERRRARAELLAGIKRELATTRIPTTATRPPPLDTPTEIDRKAGAQITLTAPGTVTVNVGYTVRGRLRHAGAGRNKTVLLQALSNRRWVTVKRQRHRANGPYSFTVYSSTAGTAHLRSVAQRNGRAIAASAQRAISVQAASPPPAPPAPPAPPTPPPPFAEPTSLPNLTNVYPPPPPGVPPGTGATWLTGWQAGTMFCNAGTTTLRMVPPTLEPNESNGYYDYYLDVVLRWDGSTWSVAHVSPWASRARGIPLSWYYLQTGQPVVWNTYSVDVRYRYAVAQYLYDGQYGNFWRDPKFGTYLSVGGGLVGFICRPG